MAVLEKWLATFESQNTIKQYKCGVARFLRLVYVEGQVETLADKYMRERAADLAMVATDVDAYFASLRERPPKTQSGYLAAVHSFLVDHRVELGDTYWRKFSRRRKGRVRALTKDYMPNNEELRRLFQHMPLRGRALFLIITSAGTRITETLMLKMSDVDLQSNPARAILRAETTKTGRSRLIFFSGEAVEATTEWLKVRTSWLRSNAERIQEHYYVDLNDDRLFPFSVENAYAIWNLALRKTGLEARDVSTHRRTLHPHCLRKRFRTLLGAENQDLTEVLMGHETGLTDAYRRTDITTLEEFYLRIEHIITLSTDRASVTELRTRTVEGEKEIDEIRREMAELKARLALLILEKERV